MPSRIPSSPATSFPRRTDGSWVRLRPGGAILVWFYDLVMAAVREDGDHESFDGKPRNESINREIFSTLREAQILMAHWRRK